MLADAVKRFETLTEKPLSQFTIEDFGKEHPDLARRLEAALNSFTDQCEAVVTELSRRKA